MSVDVEQLYKSFGVLADAKENAKQHPEEFQTIIKGVEGNTATKRLAAQFIARFFKHFTGDAERAINALLDLCEDEDVAIRIAAIKELPNLCKSDKQHLSRLADVLVQLLCSEDKSEFSAVNVALNSLFSLDAKGTLTGVLTQISSGEDDQREKALQYLASKLKSSSEAEMSKDTEEFVLEQCKKIMEDVTGDEFRMIMQGLSNLHHLQTIQGRQQLVNIITEQMGFEFEASDTDSINRVHQCVGMALRLCSRNVHGTKFLNFLCQKVLPSFDDIIIESQNGEGENKEQQSDIKLGIVKQVAELSVLCGNGGEVGESVQPLFEKLISCMPLPSNSSGDGIGATNEPQLQFSYVECLMYALHQIARYKDDFFTGDENAAKLKDFRMRLQYFARGLQVYIKQLKVSIEGKTPIQLKAEPESQIKVIALRTCNNINALIRDLFHTPPSYKANVVISWKKSVVAASPEPRPRKRSSAGGESEVKTKSERSIYKTPEGKFSTNLSYFNSGRGGRGGQRGQRGGYRGRNWGGKKY